MTAIAATPILWRAVDDEISVGTRDGSYAGFVDHRGQRYIATDQVGSVVGRFPDEASARRSLEPEAIELALERRVQHERRLAALTAVLAGAAALLAAVGMLTLLA